MKDELRITNDERGTGKITLLVWLFFLTFPVGAGAQDGRAFVLEGDISPLKEQFGTGNDSLTLTISGDYEDEVPVALDGLCFRYTGSATEIYPPMEYLFLRNESKQGEMVATIPFFREPGTVRVWCRPLPGDDLWQIEVTGTPANDLLSRRLGEYADLNYDMLALAQDTTLTYEERNPLIERMLQRQDSLMRYWYRDNRDTEIGPVMAFQHYYYSNDYRELAGELAYLQERFPGHPDLHHLESVFRRMPGLEPGDTLPPIVVRDRAGEPVHLSKLTGDHYLLIDFWSSISGQNVSDFRSLKRLPANYEGKPLVLVGISTDRSRQLWLRTLRRRRPGGIQLWDEGLEASRAFHLSTYPARFLIDPDGTVIRKGNFTALEPLKTP